MSATDQEVDRQAGAGGPSQGEYASALFATFTEAVDRLPSTEPVLDLGPAISGNLMFWIERGRPVAALDVRARMEEGETLDLDGRRFGAVICWNSLAYLPRELAQSVVDRLVVSLAPGGTIFAVFDGDGRHPPPPVQYRILGEGRLRFEPLLCPSAPRAVPTSEIERLMAPLRPTRTTVMRHGAREAMGQIPRLPRDPFPGARSLR